MLLLKSIWLVLAIFLVAKSVNSEKSADADVEETAPSEEQTDVDETQNEPPHGHGPPPHGGGGGHGHGPPGPPPKGGGHGHGGHGGGHEPPIGQGWSQQYHYQSVPQKSQAISVDLSSGMVIAIGIITLIIAIFSILAPLLRGGKGGGAGWGAEQSAGWGWDKDLSGAGTVATADASAGYSRSYNVASTAEKVLTAIEKVYNVYKSTNKKL